jgi:glycosyltransferase involved in cell wall biosynthesis
MTNLTQPLVSVITPVYNGEPYLAECIESVLAQSYTYWEYVIVNNRSTDRSGDIAHRYARRDARICVHDNVDLLPAIDNWNHALRKMSPDSRYCKVVHADDWLFPDCLKQMIALAEAHPTVGIVSAYRLDEDRVNLDGLPYSDTVVTGREICWRSLLLDQDYFGSPSSVLIRSEIVRARDPFYTDLTADTDTSACFDILQNWDFGFVHQVLTYTRRHNESRTSALVRFEGRRLAKLRRRLAYGPLYLEPVEFETRRRAWVRDHYQMLARSFLELQEPAFWHYQAQELSRLGLSLSWPRLAAAVARELLDVRQCYRRVQTGMTRRRRTPTDGPTPGSPTRPAQRDRTSQDMETKA